MIKQIDRPVYSVGKKVGVTLEIDNYVVLGSLDGYLGVLDTSTGLAKWQEIEAVKEQQIVGMQRLDLENAVALILQTKSGTFAVVEIEQPKTVRRLKLCAAIKTNFLTMSAFPCYRKSETSWQLLSTEVNDEFCLRTIDISHDYSDFKLAESSSRLLLQGDPGIKKINVRVV